MAMMAHTAQHLEHKRNKTDMIHRLGQVDMPEMSYTILGLLAARATLNLKETSMERMRIVE